MSRVCIGNKYAYTSASQVNAFRSCPRKWFNSWILEIRQPETEAMTRGTKIHAALEQYLKNQVIDEDYRQYIEAAEKFLPPSNYYLEQKIELPTFEGGPLWTGYIDVLYESNNYPSVLDYKTISSFRYCKTPDELAHDTQVCSYAKWAMEESNRDKASVSHLYLLTKVKKTKANFIEIGITKAQAQEIWERDMETVKEMSKVVAALVPKDGPILDRAEEITPNTNACDAYGGCFFRSKCGLQKESISRLVNAGKKAGQTLPQALSLPTGGSKMSSLSEKLAAKIKAAPVEVKETKEEKPKMFAVLPPDSPRVVAAEKLKAEGLPGQTTFNLDEFTTKTVVPVPTISAPASLQRKELHLYVDCLPVKGTHKNYTLLEDWLAPITAAVAVAHAQPDWRMISYVSKAALSMAIKEHLAEVPEILVISSYASGSDVALEALIPLATNIVKKI